jgi:hypothetical protein
MKIKDIVNLMLKSSDSNPYTGLLSKEDNIIAAIQLAKLCKEFADKGQKAEAMNIDSEVWIEVIKNLEDMKIVNKRNKRISNLIKK